MMHAGCIFVAGIHLSMILMSGSFESVRQNACVHRLDLGLCVRCVTSITAEETLNRK